MKHLGLVIGDALRIWFWSQQFTYLERRVWVNHLQNLPGLNNGTAGIIIGLRGACATPPMMQLSGVGIARFDTSVQNVINDGNIRDHSEADAVCTQQQ